MILILGGAGSAIGALIGVALAVAVIKLDDWREKRRNTRYVAPDTYTNRPGR